MPSACEFTVYLFTHVPTVVKTLVFYVPKNSSIFRQTLLLWNNNIGNVNQNKEYEVRE